METQQTYNVCEPQSIVNFKNMTIVILFVSLIFTVLGINIVKGMGNFMENIANIFKPLIATFGFATGTTINTATDLTTDTAKFGIDVAGGAVHDIGNLFISASDKNIIPDFTQQYHKYSASFLKGISDNIYTSASPISISPSPISVPIPVPVPVQVSTPAKTMDDTINSPPPQYINQVSADQTTSNIQIMPVSKKNNWCLIGEYKDRLGCVNIDDSDRCLSGQIFPSQQLCLASNQPGKN